MKLEPQKAAKTLSYWLKIRLQFILNIVIGGHFSLEILDYRPGFATLKISGKKVFKAFEKEPGGHRWQRVPPTEKRGRVHTSTITVVVLPEPKEHEVEINMKDVEIKATRGSGAGGQHRNKTDTAIQLWHKPSGIQVRSESCKSQHQNKEIALAILRAKLLRLSEERQYEKISKERRKQAGSGMRGDKIRTIRLQDDTVIDHDSNKKISAKKYLRGGIDLLY